MSDQFTVTTSESWFGRIGSSIGGVLFGIILLLAMIVLLFWNEGRAVTTAKSLAEGAGIVASVSSGSINLSNDGKLIHVTGDVTTGETLSDPSFGITATGVRLSRNVEMYQWEESSSSETRTKLGGGEETVTTYSYARDWSSSAHNSSNFKKPEGHSNPQMNIESRDFQIGRGDLGAFELDDQVLGRIGGARDVPVGADIIDGVRAAIGGNRPVSTVDGRIYIGFNAGSPAVGDYRIGYEFVPLGTISVIASQTGNGFAPYQTQAGDRLLMVDSGNVSAEQMFADAISGNIVLTWIVRLLGLLFLAVAFGLLFAPIGVVADVIPFLGRIVRMGTGLVAIALAALVGSATIAVAWFWYRPLLALLILAAGAAIFWFISYMGKKRGVVSETAATADST